jgi:hypothetical protein
MLYITSAPEDNTLATRLRADLTQAGYPVEENGDLLIAVLSPAGATNATVQSAIVSALDKGQHIIPVLASPVKLPKLIDHLIPLDFSQQYNLAALRERVNVLSSPDAPKPLKVLTPTVRASNNRIGVWLTVLVLAWFIIGVALVGFFGIQAPREEYNTIETIAAATVQSYLAPNIPRSTQDAENFPATLQAAPTAQRPLLSGTATAQAQWNSSLP